MYKIVNYQLFDFFIFATHCLNIIALWLCSYDPHSDGRHSNVLYGRGFNMLFIMIFITEFIMRFIATQNTVFLKYVFNKLDWMLVILTLIQISIPLENRSIDIIRQIRILRYGYFRLMLKSVYKTLAGIYEYVLLMLIVLYIFTLLGIQMFIEELPDSIRDNFNSFQNSFFTAFKVLVGENWNEIMYHVVLKTNRWSVLYFVIFMILGQFIMVNLLLAIIISEFNQSRLINTKLKAIDNIKYQLDKGKTIKRAIELVLGLDFYNKLFIDEESNKLCLKRSTIVRGKTMNRRPSLSSDSQNKEINPFDFIRSGYPLVYRSEKYLEVLRSSRFHNGQSSSRSSKLIQNN